MRKHSPTISLFVLVAALGGCAAMVRTWHFEAAPIEADALRIAVTRAAIKQKVAHVTLRLTNSTRQPERIDVGTLTLALPDGTRVRGKTSLLGRATHGAQNALAVFGLGRRAKQPELPPGGTLEARVAFRTHRRDLRRHGELRIELSGIRVNGKALSTKPLVLRAPPRAPRGEHI